MIGESFRKGIDVTSVPLAFAECATMANSFCVELCSVAMGRKY